MLHVVVRGVFNLVLLLLLLRILFLIYSLVFDLIYPPSLSNTWFYVGEEEGGGRRLTDRPTDWLADAWPAAGHYI